VAALTPVDDAEAVEAVTFALAVAQLAVDGEARPQEGERLLVAPQPSVEVAEVAQADGLAAAVAQPPLDGQALLVAGQRRFEAPLPLVDDAEVVQAGRLAVAVAQFPADGQALPVAGHRLLEAALREVGQAEVGLDLGFGGPVADPAGDLEGGLVDLHPVLPVAPHPEEGEQGVGELERQRGGHVGRGGGLLDGGQQVGALGVQPVERRSGVGELQRAAGPAVVGSCLGGVLRPLGVRRHMTSVGRRHEDRRPAGDADEDRPVLLVRATLLVAGQPVALVEETYLEAVLSRAS
jgi:hypothetical protein